MSDDEKRPPPQGFADQDGGQGAPTTMAGNSTGRGWFAVALRDIELIRDQRPEHCAATIAVWVILLKEAHRTRSLKFTLSQGIIQDRTKACLRSVKYATDALRELGLADAVSTKDHSTGKNTPMVWTLHPSVNLKKKPGASGDAPGKPGASESPNPMHSLLEPSYLGAAKAQSPRYEGRGKKGARTASLADGRLGAAGGEATSPERESTAPYDWRDAWGDQR